MDSAELIKRLEEAGYELIRVRGSHHVFKHPDGRTEVVPHPRKDLGKGLANKIMKNAGLR